MIGLMTTMMKMISWIRFSQTVHNVHLALLEDRGAQHSKTLQVHPEAQVLAAQHVGHLPVVLLAGQVPLVDLAALQEDLGGLHEARVVQHVVLPQEGQHADHRRKDQHEVARNLQSVKWLKMELAKSVRRK